MNWSEESNSELNPVLRASAEDDANEEAAAPKPDQAPQQGFGDLPATKKVTSLDKLLAGDAKPNPEKEETEDEQQEQ